MKRSNITSIIFFAVAVFTVISVLPVIGSFADEPVILREVNVTVTEPVPGEHPVFHAEFDSPYLVLDEEYTSDDLYAVNGIIWNELEYDGTFVRSMTESDEFREGYDYFIGVNFKTVGSARLGNYFADLLDVTINKERAEYWETMDSTSLSRVFRCSYTIDSIDLTVPTPVVGEHTPFDSIFNARFYSKNDDPAQEGQLYGVTWTNAKTGKIMRSTDVIEEETSYLYKVSLYPKKGYSFAPGLSTSINGREAACARVGDKIVVYIFIASVYANPFYDVSEYEWFTDAVKWCNYKKYMTGTSDTTFSPDVSFTRAMFVTVLSKIDGADTSIYTGTSFDDVPQNQWYSGPVEWAVKNGYTSGTGNNCFSPDAPITRETLAQFLYNYTKKQGKDVTASEDLSEYTDAGDISDWAADAVRWAVEKGLISGTSGTTVSPKMTATRAQVALIIMKYVENVK